MWGAGGGERVCDGFGFPAKVLGRALASEARPGDTAASRLLFHFSLQLMSSLSFDAQPIGPFLGRLVAM